MVKDDGAAGRRTSVFTIDLASDQVHSRLVSGAIWMIIPAMLAQLFVPGNLKFQELPSSDLRPASILIFNQPTVGSVVLGRNLAFPLKALVTNKHGFPIVDFTLTARASSPRSSFNCWRLP